jgi:uncharacterized membrane protein YoaK (UPF0700 family)
VKQSLKIGNKMRKDYRIFEGLRVAVLVTFTSGFINSYTFNTQGMRFSGMQTGNLLYMMIHFARGEYSETFSYLLPILSFILGQFFTYYLRKWCKNHKKRWHALGSKMLLLFMIVIVFMVPFASRDIIIVSLAFFASIQLDTFKRVRGISYANIMMTGNIKNVAQLFIKGFSEKKPKLLKQSFYTLTMIISFLIGVFISTVMTTYFFEASLFFTLIPLAILTYLVHIEKYLTDFKHVIK